MTKFVSYVPDETIEKDALALLAEYAHARGGYAAGRLVISWAYAFVRSRSTAESNSENGAAFGR